MRVEPRVELEETFTVEQVAEFLHLTPDHVRKMIKGSGGVRKQLNGLRGGKGFLVTRSELERYIGAPLPTRQSE